jgi:RNA polymerase sigma-70 factor (ECF subfamily)
MSVTMDVITAWETRHMATLDRAAAPGEREVLFARLAEAQLDAAYRLATFILAGDRAEAEDAVHDAALRAWEHLGEVRDPARFEAWFTRIVVNVCRDRIAGRRTRPITLADPDPGAAPDHAEAFVRADELEQAMRSLSANQRIVIGLRFVEDRSIEEIAVRTGERAGTVKSRLHYALRALRAALDADAREVAR